MYLGTHAKAQSGSIHLNDARTRWARYKQHNTMGVTEPLASFDPFRVGAVDHDVRGERRSVHRYSERIRGKLRVRKVLPGALRGDGAHLYAMETESGKEKMKNKKMKNKKMSLSICELLTINVILVNTLLLIIERDTISYEKDVYAFEAIKKSNLISIIQHNPYIGYVYLLCAVILVICGLCRLISRRSRK